MATIAEIPGEGQGFGGGREQITGNREQIKERRRSREK
jgi:hypothetical protein